MFVARHPGTEARCLGQGWRRVSGPPGFTPDPCAAWQPVEVPCVSGTPDADARDHWYRCDHDLPPGALLEFQGLATTAEVWIDGGPVASGNSMFRRLLVTVPHTGGAGIEVRIRALRPPAGTRRARWRTG